MCPCDESAVGRKGREREKRGEKEVGKGKESESRERGGSDAGKEREQDKV